MKKIGILKTPTINQNGYHKNILTKERIGTLFIYPTDYTPDDCLSCDGYSLLIIDYEDLYKVIGKQFNQENDPENTFRIPDYNITGRFLQPNKNVGIQTDAGLPNITGAFVNPPSSSWSDISDISAECLSGALYGTNRNQKISVNADTWGVCIDSIRLDASRSSSIYGSSNTVQPPSQTVHICIKYK